MRPLTSLKLRLDEATRDHRWKLAIFDDRIEGTWDLFRYPGIRSDSDMYTLGYAFRPWEDARSIADGGSILEYVRSTAREQGIDLRYLALMPDEAATVERAVARTAPGSSWARLSVIAGAVVSRRMRRSSRLGVEAVAARVPAAAGLVVIDDEEAAAVRVANGEFDWNNAPSAWQVRLRELAAVLVAGWPDLGVVG